MAEETHFGTATEADLELACIKERNNWLAVRQGLPPIGATMTNAHGIEWVVDSHTYASSYVTMGKTTADDDPKLLYPVSIPQNLSQKFQDMVQELNLCTPKDFVPLDTVPHLRPDQAMPFGHSVDSGSDSQRVLFFCDAARIHETVLAHELAHVWVELVEGIEDYRVLEDLSDPVRYGQVQRIQSFVLDFRVNELIGEKGFDTSELENYRFKSLEQLSIALSNGYQPPNKWESVVMAMLFAGTLLESTSVLARADGLLEALRERLPDEWALAEDLAKIVKEEDRKSTESVRRCIDRALTLCFAFAGEHLDLGRDLIERQPNVEWHDKWPDWLVGLGPQQKCTIGKAMARRGLGPNAKVRVLTSDDDAAIQLSMDGESWTEPIHLPFRLPDPTRPFERTSRIMEINEQNRRKQMDRLESMWKKNNGNRGYATGEARFITQVRMEQMLAGEQPYAYAFNNPTTYTDPSGDSPDCQSVANCLSSHTNRCESVGKGRDPSAPISLALCLFWQETSLGRQSPPGGMGSCTMDCFSELKRRGCSWLGKYTSYSGFVQSASACEKAQAAYDFLATVGLSRYGPGPGQQGDYRGPTGNRVKSCANCLNGGAVHECYNNFGPSFHPSFDSICSYCFSQIHS